MADKDKLSKEVEEQLQSLASDVSIQIEERLTQILCRVTPKEPTEKINISQDPVYIALQNNYQISQKNLAEKTHQLENNTSTLKEQLDDERSKRANSEATLIARDADSAIKFAKLTQENIDIEQQLADEIDKQAQTQANMHNQRSQKQIASDEKELLAQQQKIIVLNESLAVLVAQEQNLTERLNISESDLTRSEAQHQQKINQLEIKNQELSNSLITKQADIKLYQTEISSLESQLTSAQQGQESILNRFNANREKQEKDNDKVRETIKYLRDENNDMITQNNKQKEGFIEKISELEHKLTEYRLKFEYAQKQLTQDS